MQVTAAIAQCFFPGLQDFDLNIEDDSEPEISCRTEVMWWNEGVSVIKRDAPIRYPGSDIVSNIDLLVGSDIGSLILDI